VGCGGDRRADRCRRRVHVASLAVVEVVLLSNVVAPTKTQAALRRVHDWVRRYRGQVVVGILTLVGIVFVAQGTGTL
jgi:choline-glycine betaine transporter